MHFLRGAVVSVIFAVAAPAYAEESWPQRPVTIVVPFQVGGSADPDVVRTLSSVGGEPAPMSPDAFAAFIETERPRWRDVVKAAGIHID